MDTKTKETYDERKWITRLPMGFSPAAEQCTRLRTTPGSLSIQRRSRAREACCQSASPQWNYILLPCETEYKWKAWKRKQQADSLLSGPVKPYTGIYSMYQSAKYLCRAYLASRALSGTFRRDHTYSNKGGAARIEHVYAGGDAGKGKDHAAQNSQVYETRNPKKSKTASHCDFCDNLDPEKKEEDRGEETKTARIQSSEPCLFLSLSRVPSLSNIVFFFPHGSRGQLLATSSRPLGKGYY